MKLVINKVIEGVDRLFLSLSSLFLLIMTLLIAFDALGRYLFHQPILGVLEVTEHFLMVGIVFFAMSHVYKEGKHIRVEFLSKFFSQSLRKPLWIGFDIIAFFLFLLITLQAWDLTYTAFRLKQLSSGAVALPLFPAYFIVVLGAGLLCVRFLLAIAVQVAGGRKRAEGKEG